MLSAHNLRAQSALRLGLSLLTVFGARRRRWREQAFPPTQTALSIRCRIAFLFRRSIVTEQSPSCARSTSGHRVLDMGLHINESRNDAAESQHAVHEVWARGSNCGSISIF